MSKHSRARSDCAAARWAGLPRVALAAMVALAGGPAAAASLSDTAALRTAITTDGVFRHLDAFQAIADRNDGHRAAGSSGYEQSVAYVADALQAAGYGVHLQEFEFPFFEETEPPALSVTDGADPAPTIDEVNTLAFSGAGAVEAPLRPVDLGMEEGAALAPSTSGCEAADFAAFEPGTVALIRRGTCRFQTKVENAVMAGASGVVILNEGVDGAVGPFHGQLSEPAEIPVVGIDYATGEQLLAATRAGPVEVRLTVQAQSGWRSSHNVIAETRSGDPTRVVLVGAHLDSVPAGPGINDNASGVAIVLETALQLAALDLTPANRIRFAFWGAEELGLIGSRHYVDTLSATEREAIVAVLNFDMLGSPNYGRFVYDGGGSHEGPDRAGPAASAAIERIFLDYFEAVGLTAAPTRVEAGSDHAPFAAAGIPTGGLYAGSAERKSDRQATLFGGTAGERYDRCYHRACDTVAGISRQAIDEMSDAVAHAVLSLARMRDVAA